MEKNILATHDENIVSSEKNSNKQTHVQHVSTNVHGLISTALCGENRQLALVNPPPPSAPSLDDVGSSSDQHVANIISRDLANDLHNQGVAKQKLAPSTSSCDIADDLKEQLQVHGFSEAELNRMCHQGVTNLVLERLVSADRKLSAQERIDCVVTCTKMGEHTASQASDKDLVVVLGDTGAAKSTTINWLCGCELEFFDVDDGMDEAVRVSALSNKSSVTPIGFDSKSKTFIPVLASLDNDDVVFCDMPGQ